MLANIFTKTFRDRQLGVLIGVLGAVSVVVLGLGAYSGLDDAVVELYGSMPEAFLTMVGISEVTSTGVLILGETTGLIAPLVLSGLAISIGAGAIAGEEAAGTMGVLLGNPKSRTRVLAAKTSALVVLVATGAVLIWITSAWVAGLFSTDMATLTFGAAMVHVFAVSLFFGFFALFLGSWTGNRTLTSAVSTGLLVLSFFAAGILPLVESLADWAQLFPWHYLNGSSPLTNGVDWSDIGVLIAAVVVLAVGSWLGLNRRDLRIGEGSRTMLERMREHPLTRRLAERVTGKAKVSSITVKTATEYQGIALVSAIFILYVALAVGPMYNALSDTLVEFTSVIPDVVLAMVGFADMGTAVGWYWAEVFSLVVPAAIIVVTSAVGARSIAGEEEARTMDLLLSSPIPRSRVVAGKTAAMVLLAMGMGAGTFIGTAAGIAIGRLDIDYGNVAATSLAAVLLGLVFGGVALVVGAATGKRRVANYTTAGAALVAYFANAFFPINESLAGWAKLSPFYYYASSEPLSNGLNVGHALVLVGLAALLFLVAAPLFQRRDVRG